MQQKYGISSALRSRKHVSLAASPFPLRVKEQIKEVVLKPSKTVGLDEIEKLPDDIYTKPVDFTQSKHVSSSIINFWVFKATVLLFLCSDCSILLLFLYKYCVNEIF